MNNKKRPTEEFYDKFAMGNAISATECTGLVTHGATEEELEAYQQVFDYQTKPLPGDEIKEDKNIF